ncbi:hypothetical protein HO356_005024 [Escherichia coli]|nr:MULTISPECIES: hypothetical protein [Escherichia]EFO8017560.1 hypothetical protein [Escherichia coli]EGD4402878.1 hypothetical protein [Escherichia coli]EHY1710997.1 hypothetical protein [Escherichia coli]MDQ9310324.1 hypothetical protein [Escherichia marmotae]MWM72763.1 hypothetical protein [Escherichia coli]
MPIACTVEQSVSGKKSAGSETQQNKGCNKLKEKGKIVSFTTMRVRESCY